MKVITWNVQCFLGVDGIVDVARVVAHARHICDFDVLCLQEVAVSFPGLPRGTPFDQVAAVAALLPDHEVIFSPAVDYRTSASGPRAAFGNLVATRLPALLVERHLLPLVYEPDTPSARRTCTSVLLQAASGPVTVMNTHLEYHSTAQRRLQVKRILAVHQENCELAQEGERNRPFEGLYQPMPRTPRTILCGDFNFSDSSSEYLEMVCGDSPRAFRDVYTALHGEGGPARPQTFGLYDTTYVKDPVACDHVFATQDIAGMASRFEVDIQTGLSDHQPVFVEWEGL